MDKLECGFQAIKAKVSESNKTYNKDPKRIFIDIARFFNTYDEIIIKLDNDQIYELNQVQLIFDVLIVILGIRQAYLHFDCCHNINYEIEIELLEYVSKKYNLELKKLEYPNNCSDMFLINKKVMRPEIYELVVKKNLSHIEIGEILDFYKSIDIFNIDQKTKDYGIHICVQFSYLNYLEFYSQKVLKKDRNIKMIEYLEERLEKIRNLVDIFSKSSLAKIEIIPSKP